jgi:hypothetical protein
MARRSHDTPDSPATGRPLDRRTALARLGLSAAVAYVAPTVLHLDRSANAVVVPSPCPKGKGNPQGAPWCRRRDRDDDHRGRGGDNDDDHSGSGRRGRRSGSNSGSSGRGGKD